MTVIGIVLIAGALYLSMDRIGSMLNIAKPALKMTISTGINESDGSPTITNITFEQIQVIYKGSDVSAGFPDISVVARNETLVAAPVTYWAAQPWVEGDKNYTLTLSFRESFTPKTGDLLLLTIRFTGIGGHILGKNTAFYEWK